MSSSTICISKVRIPKRKLLIIANLVEEQEERIVKEDHKGANMGVEAIVKFKILFHFIERKIYLTPMKTILVILGELDYLVGLVKLTKKRKDVERQKNQIAAI